MAIGMNDAEIFDGSKLPQRGHSYVNIAPEIYPKDSLRNTETQVEVFRAMVDGIVDSKGQPMGKLLLPEGFAQAA